MVLRAQRGDVCCIVGSLETGRIISLFVIIVGHLGYHVAWGLFRVWVSACLSRLLRGGCVTLPE
jgi:hypothetical protein